MSTLVHEFVARCGQLGLELLPLALLGLDVVLLLALAGGVVERWERADAAGRWGAPRRLLTTSVVTLATVVGTATVLGAGRILSWQSLMASHGVLLLA